MALSTRICVAVMFLLLHANGVLTSLRSSMILIGGISDNEQEIRLLKEVVFSMNSRLFNLEKKVEELQSSTKESEVVEEVLKTEQVETNTTEKKPADDGFPKIRRMLEPKAAPDDVQGGDNVYFECLGWKREKTTWFHNGDEIGNNVGRRVLSAKNGLALQGVDRSRTGNYTCSQKSLKSDPIFLLVKTSPRCLHIKAEGGQQEKVLIGRTQAYSVSCEVESVLPDVQFTWTMESLLDHERRQTILTKIPSDMYTTNGTRSTLTYTPQNDTDFGTLRCWASNAVGSGERDSCEYPVVEILKAGTPENCQHFLTIDSFDITCRRPHDYHNYAHGVKQHFFIEVLDLNGTMVFNETQEDPMFYVHKLKPGIGYIAKVYTVNAIGRSEPAVLNDLEVILHEKPSKPFFNKTLPTMVENVSMTHDIECYVIGGVPPPKLSLFIGHEPLTRDLELLNKTLPGEESVYYTLTLRNRTFRYQNNGDMLRCVVEHDTLTPEDVKEVSMPIIVKYKPKLLYSQTWKGEVLPHNISIKLDVGQSQKHSWKIDAHPAPTVSWILNGKPLDPGVKVDGVEVFGLNKTGHDRYEIGMQLYKVEEKSLVQELELYIQNEVGSTNYTINIQRIVREKPSKSDENSSDDD